MESPFTPSALPDILTTEMVQMFISDFTANSAAFVFYQDNRMLSCRKRKRNRDGEKEGKKIRDLILLTEMRYNVTDNMLPKDFPLRLNTTYFTGNITVMKSPI